MPLNLPPVVLAAEFSVTPFIALFLGIATVVIAIAVFRIHAFISLILAAIVVGSYSNIFSGAEGNAIVNAVKDTMTQFGSSAGGIAWIIALAAIIGLCLMESGAADRIVRGMIRGFGEKRAGVAMLISAFFLSIPVFFDTVFYLMVPLAQAMAFRLGKNYVYFVVAVCAGGLITHCLVPPTPGPLIVVETLGTNLGFTIIGGILLGILPAFIALKIGRKLDSKLKIGLREGGVIKIKDLEEVVAKRDDELPSFFLSTLPVLLPVSLIALSSVIAEFSSHESLGGLYTAIEILGYKHISMFIGAIIAIAILSKQKNLDKERLWKQLEIPLSMAGTIILITAAGGAFGGMIRQSGIGEAIASLTDGSGISFILLAWLISAIMKLAQGSSTTAMITTSGIMAGILASISASGGSLGYDPFYIFGGIAFGSMFGSWMNDSGFWIVCKMTGFTEGETLKTWTLIASVIALIGIVQLLLISTVIPYPFGGS